MSVGCVVCGVLVCVWEIGVVIEGVGNCAGVVYDGVGRRGGQCCVCVPVKTVCVWGLCWCCLKLLHLNVL